MHVLYFHQYFTTPDGSTGTRSYEFAKKLIERGHSVTMVCISHDHQGDIKLSGNKNDYVRYGNIDGINLKVYSIPYSNHFSLFQRSIGFIKYASRCTYDALSMRYDLLFATSTPLTAGIPGIFASFIRKKKFIFEVRDLWPELPKAMGVVRNPIILFSMSVLEWLCYNTATSCIALSPGIADGISKRSSKNSSIKIIPNGCDIDLFKPGERKSLNLTGINENDVVAVFTGAHGIANGLDAVLDTAKELLKRHRNDIKLIFIGDGKLKPKLIKRTKDESLKNCLFFDPIPKKKLSEILGCADIGLMILDNVPAFYYGTSPNKFFDYIASGLPVVNNYPGWLAEFINKHECGIAVSPNSPEDMADALCKLSDDKDLRNKLGENARKLSLRTFDRDNLSNQFVDWLENTVDNKLSSGIYSFE